MEMQIDGKSNESYDRSWSIISEKVEQILNPEIKAIMTFEPLYSRVYKNVCDGFSEQMHVDLISLCSRHLQRIDEKLCSHNEISTEHLLSVHHDLREYLFSAKIISSIFSYLNKFYVNYYLNADLFTQLSGLFSQIVLSERISTLMVVVEESLKKPFSISPEILYNFFNELHQISNGKYSMKYLHLFSRYCPNVLPPMKETDLESHRVEVYKFRKMQKESADLLQAKHGIKRPAEEPVLIKSSYMDKWLKQGETRNVDSTQSTDTSQKIQTQKKRMYCDEYFKYVFSFVEDKKGPKPQCVVYGDILSNDCMKPSLLLRHLHTKHGNYKNKDRNFFNCMSESKRKKIKIIILHPIS